MIKIRTEKVIDGNNLLSRRVIYCDLRSFHELPSKYTHDTNAIWGNSGHVQSASGFLLSKGEIYTEEEFQKRLTHIHRAGELLKDVNDEKRRLEIDWNGREIFKI